MLLIVLIVAKLLQMLMVISDLSTGKPLPVRLTKTPPLFPAEVIESEVATRFTFGEVTPEARLAIP